MSDSKPDRGSALSNPARRCQHVNPPAEEGKTGKQCGRWAIKGGQFCIFHGGATALGRHGAKQRLLAMCEPAFATLLDAMAHADWKTKVTAAIAVLDRAGHGPKSTLTLETPSGDLSDFTLEQLEDRAMAVSQIIRNARLQSAEKAMEEQDGAHTPSKGVH
jgi:hypothetical protein